MKMSDVRGTRLAFGDVVELHKERTNDPDADGFERYVGLEHLDPGDLRIRRWGDVADGTTFTSVFRPGNVLFGKRRAYQRKVAVADFSGVCSGDIYVLKSKDASELLPELLPFLCQTDAFYHHAVGTSAGSLSPRTNWKSLVSFEFELPRRTRQGAIAATLERIDLLGATYESAISELEVVRRSILNETFAMATHRANMVPLSTLIADKRLSLQTGPFGTVLKSSEYKQEGWPVVNPTHISGHRVRFADGPRVDATTAERLSRYRMKAGDVLLARKGEIDKAALITAKEDGWIVGSDCILLRTNDNGLAGEFIVAFLQAPSTSARLRSLSHGTVMPGLNEKILGALELPVADEFLQLELKERLRAIDEGYVELVGRQGAIERLRGIALNTMLLGKEGDY